MSEGNALAHTKHLGQKFSTRDQDNDAATDSCAVRYTSAWWFGSCYSCNLNGPYYKKGDHHGDGKKGLVWDTWTGDSLQKTEMKIRPY